MKHNIQAHEGLVDIPEILPILPLRNSALFPGSIIPIDVGRKKSVRLLEEMIGKEQPVIGVLAQRAASTEDPGDADLYSVGCAARVLKAIRLAKDNLSVVLQGVSRVRILEYSQHEPFITARVQAVPELHEPDVEIDALVLHLKHLAKRLVKLTPALPQEAAALFGMVPQPGQLADLIASNLDISAEEKQDALETFEIKLRLRKVMQLLSRQLEVLKVREEINTQVQKEMGRNQREYVLRRQLNALRGELGEVDDGDDDLEELEDKIADAKMPPEAEKAARQQYDRLKTIPPSSPEYAVSRTYLEWLVELPWVMATEDLLEIDNVRRVLDEDHYDLDRIKKRIVEYVAVRKLKPDKKGPILCLVGPPGVGKTSLGRSIARAIGRKFIRVSLGGVRDEAEIRGHRRTYVGSLPGRIIQNMKKVGTVNPVFMLDEIDKLGHDFHGDPASALLEVLDPEQNHSFSDHYLEVSYDLSRVVFICTANFLDPVPPALRDRLEILELPGYTRDEKMQIARQFLIPKQLGEHGLDSERLTFEDASLGEIIDSYTREAGVRNLEREIASVIRGCAVKVAEGKTDGGLPAITSERLLEFLGPQKFVSEVAERTAEPGVATGLAWTPFGGDIIFIEATRMPGTGSLLLTGQLGEVMKESAHAALSYVRTHARDLGLEEGFFEGCDIHVHVPAGAIRKDGPSAGITLFIALASLLKNRRVRPDVAVTGEITLRGAVLPVGGIKEKVLAAHRAGIKTVVLPERNQKDMVDVPEQVKNELSIRFVQMVDEVLPIVLSDVSR
jgi:ATP-dependent Lon protease